MNNFSSIWEKSLKILENEISSVSYETWIKDIRPVVENENNYYFEVSNPLHKNIIDDRYKNTIKQSILKAYSESGSSLNSEDIHPIFLTKEKLSLLDLKKTRRPQVNPSDSYNATLNPGYSFDNFVVGSSNKFAHAASVAVAEAPGKSYNPLFLYGTTGLGKTHLMHAIGNFVVNEFSSAFVMYVTGETFTNELIASIASNQTGKNEQFRNKYRNVDVLLIDDIQFIAGKESTQEEFFHTFNSLYEANKQIIVSSDKPPKEIVTLEERLRSRFEWGLIADIQPPDYETRVAILMKKAKRFQESEHLDIPISEEIMHYIASKCDSNIRQLEGALQKVLAYARLNNAPVDIDLVKMILDEIIKEQVTKIITPQIIIQTVCEYFDLGSAEIKGTKKNREIAYPRQITRYIVRTLTDLSYPKIGEIFGGRDHSTVMHAEKKIKNDIKNNIETERLVKDLIQKIKE